MVLRRLVDLAVPVAVALIACATFGSACLVSHEAFLHAHAIGALVDATTPPSSIAPFAEAHASTLPPAQSARTVARNVFDHTTRTEASDDVDVDVPPCDGVRATAAVKAEDDDISFAAMRVGGKASLRRAGDDVGALKVVRVGADRVWLEQNGRICVVGVFAPPSPTAQTAPHVAAQPSTTNELVQHIARTGPNEVAIDRGAVDRILEAPMDLLRTPIVPESGGYRLVRVTPGSMLAALGLQSGDRLTSVNGLEVTSTENLLAAALRLRTGTLDRVTLGVVRNGSPTNLDFVVR